MMNEDGQPPKKYLYDTQVGRRPPGQEHITRKKTCAGHRQF